LLPAETLTAAYQPRRLARERRLATAEGQISVTQWGPADAVPIVLLHGWMDCARGWQLLVDCLPDDWALAAIDWRGYGQSEPRVDRYWLPDYLAELECVLQELWPVGHAGRIIGHSLGGTVASAYAGIRTQRLSWLVNMEGFGLPRLDPKVIPEHLGQWLDELRSPPGQRGYASLEQLATVLQQRNPLLPMQNARYLAGVWTRACTDGVELLADSRHRLSTPLRLGREELHACWSRTIAPVLLLYGAESRALPMVGGAAAVERWRSLQPGLQVVGIEQAGHLLQHERPAAVAAQITGFVTGLS
jgi:pimeloyl-ACP methyl ester carboxylesterase